MKDDKQVAPTTYNVEVVEIDTLKPHQRNYRVHPEDELAHLAESIKEHGFYRNVVVARESTLLAGHGVVLAAKTLGHTSVPVIRLDLDPDEPRALKVLAGDNEIAHLVESDDRKLTELLKEILDNDVVGLLGTGYDEMMLANLVMVTRPSHEIQDFDAAAEWVGLPDYQDADGATNSLSLAVHFETVEDRHEFAERLGITLSASAKYTWFPPRAKQDGRALKFLTSDDA